MTTYTHIYYTSRIHVGICDSSMLAKICAHITISNHCQTWDLIFACFCKYLLLLGAPKYNGRADTYGRWNTDLYMFSICFQRGTIQHRKHGIEALASGYYFIDVPVKLTWSCVSSRGRSTHTLWWHELMQTIVLCKISIFGATQGKSVGYTLYHRMGQCTCDAVCVHQADCILEEPVLVVLGRTAANLQFYTCVAWIFAHLQAVDSYAPTCSRQLCTYRQ